VAHPWARIHDARFGPIWYGKAASNRFDAPAGEFGVLYLAKDAHGAFIETFGHDTGRVPFVTESELRARGLAWVAAKRPLNLVDLRGEGLARLGADAEMTSGGDYGLSRRWARAIHDHPRAPDGILYRARHDPARTCAALFERADAGLTAKRVGSLLDPKNRKLLGDILDTYGYGLVSA
jgi:hypothetical protein